MRLNKALIVAVAVFMGVASADAAAETPAESPAQDNGGRTACLADFDGSGRVDFADFVALAGLFGTEAGDANYNARGDLDNDGKVAFADFVAFAGVFGMPCVTAPASEDREALVALYNATGGQNWSSNTNWLSNRPLDEWSGVTTDDSGHVTILSLGGNALTGSIPRELGSLTKLKRLGLRDNRLTGAIPPALGSLTNLTELSLAANELTGPIPRELGSLPNLTELNLRWNALTGAIPPELGNLANLKELWLDVNALTGQIPPELGNLTNMTELHLGYNPYVVPGFTRNELTGAIPPELGSLANLEVLNLSYNALTGSIPPALGSLTNLTELDLAANELTGPIPSWLGSMANLQRLDLFWNELTGPIPPALGSLTKLKRLGLRDSRLTGAIPPALGSLTNLTELSLAANELTGAIPPELGNLANLKTLWLAHNALTGAIPPELGNLANLKTLWLDDNALTGPIPPELGSLTNLTGLNLADNELTGPIPPELGSLANLHVLNLGYNALTGSIPPALGGLTNLEELDLSLNTITDIKALLGLTNLHVLYFRGNSLNDDSVNHHISALKSRGVRVFFVAPVESDFDIELVFLDAFTEQEKRILNYAARHWTWVITRDVPDYTFAGGWSGECGDRSYEIPSGTRIDDLRIYVTSHEGPPSAWGGPHHLRDESYLPIVGCMSFNLIRLDIGLHEIAHVLGFGPVWDDLGFLRDPDGDIHFNGPLAIGAFDDAGGRNHAGAKVPLSDTAHWRGSLMDGEVMVPWGGPALSAITVQSMADIGYGVNVASADAYTLPGAAGKVAVKLAAPARPIPRFGMDVGTGYGVRQDGQGRVVGTISSDATDDRWNVHPGTGGGMGTLRRDSRVGINGLSDRTGLRDAAEARPWCGAGLRTDPIYVVDQTGRVVRTIGER